ncbi:unnamed protein product [Brassica oleracea var. botrytis]
MNKTSSVSLYSHFLIWVFSINDFKNIQFHHLIRTRTNTTRSGSVLDFQTTKFHLRRRLRLKLLFGLCIGRRS